LILTVGLPARGKTHISRALERYLRWMGIKTLVVSLGDYRRRVLGSAQKLPSDYFTLGVLEFLSQMYEINFDPGEKSAKTEELRKKISNDCENTIWNAFEQGTQIIIYDANNGTKARREAIANKFHDRGIHVIMLGKIVNKLEVFLKH
jgi:6-phosphofructo-2-kinase / fructose-2,6-biphosphatase 4